MKNIIYYVWNFLSFLDFFFKFSLDGKFLFIFLTSFTQGKRREKIDSSQKLQKTGKYLYWNWNKIKFLSKDKKFNSELSAKLNKKIVNFPFDLLNRFKWFFSSGKFHFFVEKDLNANIWRAQKLFLWMICMEIRFHSQFFNFSVCTFKIFSQQA